MSLKKEKDQETSKNQEYLDDSSSDEGKQIIDHNKIGLHESQSRLLSASRDESIEQNHQHIPYSRQSVGFSEKSEISFLRLNNPKRELSRQNSKFSKSETPFSNKFLGKKGTSADYLKEVIYDIPLRDLFQIKSTLYRDQRLDFCPVILEINSEELQNPYNYGAKYIFQIWSKKGLKKVQMKMQTDQPYGWNISNNFCIIRQMQTDDFVTLIDLRNRIKYRLKNFQENKVEKDTLYETKEFFQMVEEFLFVSNGHIIRVYDLRGHLSFEQNLEMYDNLHYSGVENVFKINMSKIKFQEFDFRKSGLYSNVLMFGQEQSDTSTMDIRLEVNLQRSFDSQVVFCILNYDSINKKFKFEELETVFPRNNYFDEQNKEGIEELYQDDPILKFQQVTMANGDIAGIALRGKSKHVDFYWNRFLVDSQEYHSFECQSLYQNNHESKKPDKRQISRQLSFVPSHNLSKYEEDQDRKGSEGVRFIDINIDFTSILLMTEQNIFEISISRGSKIGIKTGEKLSMNVNENDSEAVKKKKKIERWNMSLQNLIRNHFKLYFDFQINHTDLYVCHSHIVSIFDTIKMSWRHISLDGFILSIFTELRDDLAQSDSQQNDIKDKVDYRQKAVYKARLFIQEDKFQAMNEGRSLYKLIYDLENVNIGGSEVLSCDEFDVKEVGFNQVENISSWAQDNETEIGSFFLCHRQSQSSSEQNEQQDEIFVLASSHGNLSLVQDEELKRVLTPNSIIKTSFDLQEDEDITFIVINPTTYTPDSDSEQSNENTVKEKKESLPEEFYIFSLVYNDEKGAFDAQVIYSTEVQIKKQVEVMGKNGVRKEVKEEIRKRCMGFPLQEVYKDFDERGINEVDFNSSFFIHFSEEKFKRVVMFIQDRIFIYKIGKEAKILNKIELECNVIGINLVDQSWIYILQENKDDPTKNGCFIYDMFRLVKCGKINNYEIIKTINGVNNILKQSRENRRLCMMQDYQSIALIPSLHSSQIHFYGMQERSNYIVWRELYDKFACMDTNFIITVWSKTTGKQIPDNKDEENQTHVLKIKKKLKGYQIFCPNPNDQTYKRNYMNSFQLLVSKQPLKKDKKKLEFEIEQLKNISFSKDKGSNQNFDDFYENLEFRKYKIVRIVGSDLRQLKIVHKFYHPYYRYNESKNYEQQRLIFSDDLSCMIEILHESKVFVYMRDSRQKDSKWVFMKRIKSFPINFVDQANPKAIFSPNLERFLDYDTVQKEFVLRSTYKISEPYIRIPKGLVSQEISESLNMTENEFLKEFKKRFMWTSNDSIRMISFLDKMDAIFKIVEDDQGQQTLELNSVILPRRRLFQNPDGVDSLKIEHEHFFYQRKPIRGGQTIQQLNDTLILMKSEYIHKINPQCRSLNFDQFPQSDKEKQSALSEMSKDRQQEYIEQIKKQTQMYEIMFKVNYDPETKFYCQTSFSYLNWRIAEKINLQPDFNFGDVYQNQCMEMSFCIYPYYRSLLHIMVQNEQNLHELFQLSNSVFFIKQQTIDGFEIPFQYDLEGRTPVDYLIDDEKQNLTNLEIVLSNIMNYSYDHHDRMIREKIPNIIESQIEIVGDYLDARIKSLKYVESCQMIRRGKLMIENEDQGYIMRVQPIWFDVKQFQDTIFEKIKGKQTEEEFECEKFDVEIQFICFNDVFNHSQTGQDIMLALSITDDLSLFQRKSIKLLIDHKWNEIRHQSVRRLLMPYLNYLLTYWCWAQFLYDYRDQGLKYSTPNKGVSLILFGYAFYFLAISGSRLNDQGPIEYFSSIWNYFDFFPPLVNSTVVIMFYFSDERLEIEPTLMSITSVMMWTKLLNFFRLHEETGYIIRMLIQVIIDMKIFMFVLFITILAFADAFYITARATHAITDEKGQIVQSFNPFSNYIEAIRYSYLSGLGDFDYGSFDDSGHGTLSWTIFLIATLLNCVVMFNLLIAFVSETFAAVLAEKQENSYREKASIILENYFLLSNDHTSQDKNEFDVLIKIAPETGKTLDYNALSAADDEEEDEDGNKIQRPMSLIISEQRGQKRPNGQKGPQQAQGATQADPALQRLILENQTLLQQQQQENEKFFNEIVNSVNQVREDVEKMKQQMTQSEEDQQNYIDEKIESIKQLFEMQNSSIDTIVRLVVAQGQNMSKEELETLQMSYQALNMDQSRTQLAKLQREAREKKEKEYQEILQYMRKKFREKLVVKKKETKVDDENNDHQMPAKVKQRAPFRQANKDSSVSDHDKEESDDKIQALRVAQRIIMSSDRLSIESSDQDQKTIRNQIQNQIMIMGQNSKRIQKRQARRQKMESRPQTPTISSMTSPPKFTEIVGNIPRLLNFQSYKNGAQEISRGRTQSPSRAAQSEQIVSSYIKEPVRRVKRSNI